MNNWIYLYDNFVKSTSFSVNWIDLGSAGSMDAYLLPLLLTHGKFMFIDGRYEPALNKFETLLAPFGLKPTTNIFRLDCFVSGSCGVRYVYETPEGTGSTLYPNQRLDTAAIVSAKTPLKRYPVTTSTLSSYLQSHNSKLDYLKLDIEGSEYDVLSDLFALNICPLIIESEVNISAIDTQRQRFEVLRFLSDNGYRLLDFRPTYDFPSVENSSEFSSLVSNLSLSSSSFQGILDQFDGLFIHDSLLSMPIKDNHTLCIITYLLTLYRQFHLATRLVDISVVPTESKTNCIALINNVIKEMIILDTENPSSRLGLNPLTNWLKRF